MPTFHLIAASWAATLWVFTAMTSFLPGCRTPSAHVLHHDLRNFIANALQLQLVGQLPAVIEASLYCTEVQHLNASAQTCWLAVYQANGNCELGGIAVEKGLIFCVYCSLLRSFLVLSISSSHFYLLDVVIRFPSQNAKVKVKNESKDKHWNCIHNKEVSTLFQVRTLE